MAAHTSMLHVRVDDKLKAAAAENLANFGLSISDAVRILLARVAKEGGLPAGLTSDPEAHDTWFRSKVIEALADQQPTVSHQHQERSEEHTSELQSLMRISYAVFCLKKKQQNKKTK